eukprot:g4607.t1
MEDSWYAKLDKKSGRLYYINRQDKKTAWKLPVGASVSNPEVVADYEKNKAQASAAKAESGVLEASASGSAKANASGGADVNAADSNDVNVEVGKMMYQESLNQGIAPPPLAGWFAKANKNGKVQRRYLVLKGRFLSYFKTLEDVQEGNPSKDPIDLNEVLAIQVPSKNSGFEKLLKSKNHDTTEDIPIDILARGRILSVVCEDQPQARILMNVLTSWKSKVVSGWFYKINKFGFKQKRWLILRGCLLYYYKDPHSGLAQKKPINLNHMEKKNFPSTKWGAHSEGFDLVIRNRGTYTFIPANESASTVQLMELLLDWQTLSDLESSDGTHHEIEYTVIPHPEARFGMVVCLVPPLTASADGTIQSTYEGHQHYHIRLTVLKNLKDGSPGPAETAGLALNDTIHAINDVPIHRVEDAARELANKKVARITVVRFGEITEEEKLRAQRSKLAAGHLLNADELDAEKEKMKDAERAALKAEKTLSFRRTKKHKKRAKRAFGESQAREGWREAKDEDSGKSYWYHTSGKTSWTKPQDGEEILG